MVHYGQPGDWTACHRMKSATNTWDRSKVTCGQCKRTVKWKFYFLE